MIAFCEPLTLWSPSIGWMEKHNCPVPGEKLLRLIEKGHVRVAGREDWLTKERWRNERATAPDGWEGYEWSDYDNQLLGIYNEDLKKKEKHPEEMRVWAAPKEPGPEYATETLKNPNDPAIAAAKELLSSGVPAAWAERIKPGMTEDDKIYQVLRHSHNHAWGREQARSDLIIYPNTETPWLFLKSVGSAAAPEARRQENEDMERLLAEGIKILGHLRDRGSLPTVDFIDKFVNEGYRDDLVRWLDRACRTYSPLREQNAYECMERTLKNMIIDGLVDKPHGWRSLIPRTLKARSEVAIEAVTAAAFIVLGHADPAALCGLAVSAIWFGRSALEAAGKVPLSGERYSGVQAPFIAETGKKATESRIYKILRDFGIPKPEIIRKE